MLRTLLQALMPAAPPEQARQNCNTAIVRLMFKFKTLLTASLVLALIPVHLLLDIPSSRANPKPDFSAPAASLDILAPTWKANIRRWSPEIYTVSQKYGLDPDLIAAVVQAESQGDPVAESYMGAVGLMGVMPTGPGFEWRPTREELRDPFTNLDWGTAILAEILRQSGGDINAALAAYNGGWEQTDIPVTQHYAAQVLNFYGQAVAARSGISPEIATEWSIAVEFDRGYIPSETLLLGKEPLSGLRTYGEHMLFYDIDTMGRSFYVRAYAVPVGLRVPWEEPPAPSGRSDTVEPIVLARLGLGEPEKVAQSNPHVLLACLPSLKRLRGRVSTRWFAPDDCPAWKRAETASE